MTNNVTDITSWGDTQAITRGTQIWVRLCRRDTEVREFPCTFIAAKTESGEKLITVITPETLFVGPGDSGSPVGWYNPQTKRAEVIGMLCYGTGSLGDSHTFKARHMEDVRTVDSRSTTGFEKIGVVNYLSGISQAEINRLERYGVSVPQNTRLMTRKAGRGGPGMTINPIAGMKVSVNDISGDTLNGGAIGTIGYIAPGRMDIFGHSYAPGGAGDVDIPATLAGMTMFTGGLQGYCDATPLVSEPLGAVTKDYLQSCQIERGRIADTVPVILNLSLPADRHFSHSHSVARGSEFYFYISLATIAMIDMDRAKRAKGTATGTFTLTLDDGEEILNIDASDPNDVTMAVMRQYGEWLDKKITDKKIIRIEMDINITDDYTAPPPDEGGMG